MQAGVAGDAVGRSSALDESLARAHQLAVTQGHGSVALEHLLFALTDDAEATGILASGRGSLDQLRTDVSAHIGRLSETMPGEAGKAPVPGADLLRILQLAGMAARQSQRRTIDGGIVLAAVIGDGNSPAAGLLKAHGLTFDDAIRALQQVGTPRQQEIAPEPMLGPRPEAKRAELPAPAQAVAPAVKVQVAEVVREKVADVPPPTRAPAATASADDVLAATRARVKKSEPQAILPVVAPPPPIQAVKLPAPTVQVPMPVVAQGPVPVVAPERAVQTSRPAAAASPPKASLEPLVAHVAPVRLEAVPLRPVAPPAAMPPVPLQSTQQSAPPLARLRHVGVPNGVASAPMQPPMPRPQASPPFQPPPLAMAQAPTAAQMRPAPPRSTYPPAAPALTQPPQAPPPRSYAPPTHAALPPVLLPPVLLPIEPLDIVSAAGGLPASVRRNAPVLIEIRIPRAQVDVPRHGPYAHSGAALVRAVTVRLTSGPVSGLSIEPRTPETAWLGPAEGETIARDIVWQYVLLPTRPGTFAVTLHVAGRTITSAGMTSDVASSAETFAVKVKGVRGSFLRRLSSWLMLLAVGGALGWALTGPLSGLVKALFDAVRR